MKRGDAGVSGLLEMLVHIADDNAGPNRNLRPRGFVHPDELEWRRFAETSQWAVELDESDGTPGMHTSKVEEKLEPEDYMVLERLAKPQSITQIQRYLQAKGILSVKYNYAAHMRAERMVQALVDMGLVEQQRVSPTVTRYVRKRAI